MLQCFHKDTTMDIYTHSKKWKIKIAHYVDSFKLSHSLMQSPASALLIFNYREVCCMSQEVKKDSLKINTEQNHKSMASDTQ